MKKTKKYQRVEELYNSNISSSLFHLTIKAEKLNKERDLFWKNKYPKGF